jgi:Na+-translocating ferredoxin:NAD+ oxidoreductase subunit D
MEKRTEIAVGTSPHIHSVSQTGLIMWTVSACLLPSGIWGIYTFGLPALWTIIASVASAVLAELVITGLRGKIAISDGSAFLTGLLVAYNMPPNVPGFIPIAASAFAILVVKQTFGGLGKNWMNPALAGRVFALFCWTKEMTTWAMPHASGIDALSGATPLSEKAAGFLAHGSYLDLFLGNIPGSLGEVSKLLLLAGGIFLLAMKIINWEIPILYIGSFSLLIWIFGDAKSGSFFSGDVLFHLLSGGLILGAFFMATDMVTTPLTKKGMIIFGLGCGVFTFLIRSYGSFPEGVSLAIIIMNITVPLINRFTKPKRFGLAKEASGERQ